MRNMCYFPEHLSLCRSQGGNPSYVPNLLEATSCPGSRWDCFENVCMPYKYFLDFIKSLVLNAEQKAMYLMQIENNWDSMSGKIPRKNNFYDFDKPTDQPTNQPTLWFCGEPPSTPGHTSPQQAPDPTTWRLAGPGNKFWMNNVDLCDLWHFLWLKWLVTMLSPQELRSRAKESSSNWGQYLRIMLDLKLKGLSYIYDQTYIHVYLWLWLYHEWLFNR